MGAAPADFVADVAENITANAQAVINRVTGNFRMKRSSAINSRREFQDTHIFLVLQATFLNSARFIKREFKNVEAILGDKFTRNEQTPPRYKEMQQ